ncbi:hypothetical protein [Nocardioides pyridinolyticus]
MEWVLLALAVAGGSGWVGRRWRSRRADAAESRAELEGVRRLAEEDVTVLGEQLRRLDAEVAGRPLDDAARVDYQTALDAYESAGRAAPRIAAPDEVSKVVDTLAIGRYALACVQARVQGRPVPERRVPCFFNPQHGPSVTDVMWTPGRGGGTRRVPACAQDAARVAAHEDPEVRTVTIRSRRVPYWEAGGAYQPYGEGYFASAAVMTWAFQPPAVPDSWSGPDGGHGGGFDVGGFDVGGFDVGGFDGGGGDGS